MVAESILDFMARSLAETPEGIAALILLGTVFGGFAFGGWARRRYLMDLRVLREIVELETITEQNQHDLGLATDGALKSAQRWRKWAYDTPTYGRIFLGSIGTGALLTAILFGVTNPGFFSLMGVLAVVVTVAIVVVLAAVIFVLVSDLGSNQENDDAALRDASMSEQEHP